MSQKTRITFRTYKSGDFIAVEHGTNTIIVSISKAEASGGPGTYLGEIELTPDQANELARDLAARAYRLRQRSVKEAARIDLSKYPNGDSFVVGKVTSFQLLGFGTVVRCDNKDQAESLERWLLAANPFEVGLRELPEAPYQPEGTAPHRPPEKAWEVRIKFKIPTRLVVGEGE